MRSLTPILSLLMACVAGCGSSESASDSSKPSAPPAEVRLGYFANLTHAQAVLGVSSKEFEQALAPSKLTTHIFNAGPSLIEALDSGDLDIGYVGPGPVLAIHQKSHGEAVRVIAGAAANGVVIVAGKDSGINSLADLKGKRLATPQAGNTQDISAKHYLLSELKQDDVANVLPVANTEQLQLLATGKDRRRLGARAVGVAAHRRGRRKTHRRGKRQLARQAIHPHPRRHHTEVSQGTSRRGRKDAQGSHAVDPPA